MQRRKSVPPDLVDLAVDLDHGPRAAVQAVDVPEVVVTLAAAVKVGLAPGLHLHAIATVQPRRRVRADLAVLGHPVAMLVQGRVVLGEILAAMTGVVVVVVIATVDARAQRRAARVAVAVAAVVVVAVAAKSTTKCRPPAASSTTSTTGIRPSPASRGSARRTASRRAFGVDGRLPNAIP